MSAGLNHLDYSQAEYYNDLYDDHKKERAVFHANERCAACKSMIPEESDFDYYPFCQKSNDFCPEHEKDCCDIVNKREGLTEEEYEVYQTLIYFMIYQWRMPTQEEIGCQFDHSTKWAHSLVKRLEKKGYIEIHSKSRGIRLKDFKVRLERINGEMI